LPRRPAFFFDREDGDQPPPRPCRPVLIRMNFSSRLHAPSPRPSIIFLISLPPDDSSDFRGTLCVGALPFFLHCFPRILLSPLSCVGIGLIALSEF
jgi:hypothetical protein